LKSQSFHSAEAERLKAQRQIQISDLQRRALHRFLEEQAKKQNNIEDITKKASTPATEAGSLKNK
jgi:hypothetical protein